MSRFASWHKVALVNTEEENDDDEDKQCKRVGIERYILGKVRLLGMP